MRIILLSTLASLVLSFTGYSQSLDEVIKVGNQSFDTKDYYNAYRCYEMVLGYIEKDKYRGGWDSLYIKYRYAEAAQRFNYFQKADSVYTILLKESLGNNMDVYARSTFNLARVKQSLAEESTALNLIRLNRGTLEEARALYRRFLDENLRQHLRSFPSSGKDSPAILSTEAQLAFAEEAGKSIADCERAIRLAEAQPGGFALVKDTISRLPDIVNSEYSDLAPVLRGSGLYFSSVKFPSKPDRLLRQSRIYSQVLKASYSGNAQDPLADIVAVDTLAREGFFNDSDDFSHTIHTAITRNGEWMYFSHCPQGRGEDPNCTLYRRKNSGGAWGRPEYMDINVDSTRFTTTQPSISYNFRTGEQWLYFASDREGSKGQLDIWRCRVNEEDGSLGAPAPLAEVNSEWNDATPSMHFPSGQLFFSSDRESTFGLYDNFVWKTGDPGSAAENLGLPYNSGYNDQYYFLSDEGDQAFFSSDRPASTRFVDSLNACCQDIYTYPIDTQVELNVEICGCNRSLPITESLKIYDITHCDCEKEDNRVSLDALRKYHKYRLVASYENFVTNRDVVVFFDGRYNGKLDTTISLSPDYIDLTFSARDSLTGEPLELADSAPTAASEGAPAAERLGENTYRLNPGYDYKLNVKAKNSAYTPKTIKLNLEPIRTQGCETSCDTDYHISLAAPCPPDSLKGIIFYFDNDKPSRIARSRWTKTNERFNSVLADPYYAQKEEYKAFNLKPYTVRWRQIERRTKLDTVLNFNNEVERIDTLLDLGGSAGQDGLESETLRYFVRKNRSGKVQIIPDTVSVGGRIERFFDRDLKGNLDKFNGFITYLKNYLATGNEVALNMRAYCSIRVSNIYSSYNDSLAVRRILCIENSLRDAGLDEYLDNGSLKINSKPLADSEAARNFPDPNLNPDADDGGKLFLSAALDRRVEITSIEIKGCKEGLALSGQTTTKNPGQP